MLPSPSLFFFRFLLVIFVCFLPPLLLSSLVMHHIALLVTFDNGLRLHSILSPVYLIPAAHWPALQHSLHIHRAPRHVTLPAFFSALSPIFSNPV
jgi:hypothetical protein